MEEIEEKTINQLWTELNSLMRVEVIDFKDLRERYGLILQLLGLLNQKRMKLWCQINAAGEKPEEYLEGTRKGILKGLHYEERKHYYHLTRSNSIQDALYEFKMLNGMLEAIKRYEGILKSLSEAMRIDLKISYEGHDRLS